MVVPASTTKAEQVAAGMFLKFLGQPENSVQISSATGFMPVRKSSDLASVVQAMPQFAFARDQLALLRTQDWARVYLPNAAEAIGAASTAITVDPTVDAAGRLAALKTLLEDRYTSDVQPILG